MFWNKAIKWLIGIFVYMPIAGADNTKPCHVVQNPNGTFTYTLQTVPSCPEYSWSSKHGILDAHEANLDTSLVESRGHSHITYKSCQRNVTYGSMCTRNFSCLSQCTTVSSNDSEESEIGPNPHFNYTTPEPQKDGGSGLAIVVIVIVVLFIFVSLTVWKRKRLRVWYDCRCRGEYSRTAQDTQESPSTNTEESAA